ncbi:amidase domain-containing protein [Virgisporangium aurantiacum]|nr:amidase domain-containing protein [Virgisporangium aurantiacum]
MRDDTRRTRHVPYRVTAAVIAAGAITTSALVGGAAPASAAPTFRVEWTKIGIYPRSAPSMASARFGTPALSDGTPVAITCENSGQEVSSAAGTSTIWEQLSDGSWLPNVFVYTGSDSWTPGVPRCPQPAQEDASPAPATNEKRENQQQYRRQDAVDWALAHVNDTERYKNSDCTWFVSQALWAGGLPKTGDWTDSSWDPLKLARKLNVPGPTKAAAQANFFRNTVSDEGFAIVTEIRWSDNTAGGAKLGDVIAYDWDKGPNNSQRGSDGLIDHLAIVTHFNQDGYPEVSQHTAARTNRYWSWDPEGNWIEFTHPTAKVYLIHITK